MVYRKIHDSCENGCREYAAYIRIKQSWHKVGIYHTICGDFASSARTEEEGRRQASIATGLLLSERTRPKQRKQRDSLRSRIREMYFPPNHFKAHTP